MGNDRLWYLQGLRWAPGGLVFLAGAVLASTSAPVRWLGWLAAVLAASRLHHLAQRYYGRRFGVPRAVRASAVTRWAGLYLLVGVAVVLDVWWQPPFFIAGAGSAAALLAYRRATGGGRAHYRAGAVALAGLSVLPALGIVHNGRPMLLVWMVVVGLLYLALGLLDHRQFVRYAAVDRERTVRDLDEEDTDEIPVSRSVP
jgi:hypothetical protein